MLILCNGKLIDGTGHDPVDRVSIVVEGNRNKSIEPSTIYTGNKNTVDLKGLTI